ncbi:MAG: hypothetical protein GY749_01570, partial [Desulfobacteraceae bacterium]|nr:hypothetical protein [Desulfobacteraceae bacterium]
MKYPLPEKIGDPTLLVGREDEFALLNNWLELIPRRLGKSKVILARRKSGKTAIVQRIFNRLWSENGTIIPFYYNFPERKTWYPDLAANYFCTFASQYISFFERDENLVRFPLVSLEDIKRKYSSSEQFRLLVRVADNMLQLRESGMYDSMWTSSYSAPERIAAVCDQRILVILDEFQNITQYVCRNEACEREPDETLAGSFHDVVESKIAPMLVTGSYVGWLVRVIDKYLEAGRLKRTYMNPYLTPEEGLQAVYRYAEAHNTPVTNESAEQISRLCMSDPFFISCVILSSFKGKDLTTPEGVAEAVNYEITDEGSEMSMTWGEYIELTLKKVNDRDAKDMLLFLSRHNDRDWTHRELKDRLGLKISEKVIREKLEIMRKADIIGRGAGDIRYRGLRDGTLNLILRHRFEEEIKNYAPDLKKEFSEELERLKVEKDSLRGKLNSLTGKYAEFQLFTEFRSRKRFSLSAYFDGVKDRTMLNITEVRMSDKFQRPDGKEMEIDVLAESECGRTVLAEVKKTKEKIGLRAVREFHEKTAAYLQRFPGKKILPAFLSVGGFTKGAAKFCKEKDIGVAEQIAFFQ